MPTITIDQFMDALSGQESGGDYDAQNSRTGAYGRFQILPSNWPSWSAEAGIPGAPPTPENQERVARYKLQQYYDRYGNWEDVAAVWYSGAPLGVYDPERKQGPTGAEPSIREYVQSVMGRVKSSPSLSNARGLTSSGITFDIPGGGQNMPTPNPLGSTARLSAGNSSFYTSTGDYDKDIVGYWNAAETAWRALDSYQTSSPDTLIIDEGTGTVYKLTGEFDDKGQPVMQLDPKGSKLLQTAIANQTALERLDAAKKAGIFQSGSDAAKAFLESEKEKAEEASRNYNDYVTRIKDLVALEDLPTARAQSLAAALSSANEVNNNRQSRFSSSLNVKAQPVTDMSPFAQAIKSTIPGQAPAPYAINPEALKQAAAAGKVPMLPPTSPNTGGTTSTVPMVPATGIELPDPATGPIGPISTAPPGSVNAGTNTSTVPGVTVANGSYPYQLPAIDPVAFTQRFGASRFSGR